MLFGAVRGLEPRRVRVTTPGTWPTATAQGLSVEFSFASMSYISFLKAFFGLIVFFSRNASMSSGLKNFSFPQLKN